MDMNRRQFFRVSGAGLAASSLVALGFSPTAALAETRNFKLSRATETRNTCPYCSVGCGIIMYSLGDKAKNVTSSIIHIEGDPDHPVNRGTLCPARGSRATSAGWGCARSPAGRAAPSGSASAGMRRWIVWSS